MREPVYIGDAVRRVAVRADAGTLTTGLLNTGAGHRGAEVSMVMKNRVHSGSPRKFPKNKNGKVKSGR
jgi:hypothetical protein